MNERHPFSVHKWRIVFTLFACMKSLIDKDKDEIFVFPSIFALRCAPTLAACLEVLHGTIHQDIFDVGKSLRDIHKMTSLHFVN